MDCEKSCLGAAVQQRGIDADIRQTKHDRRLCAHTTDAASSGSFLRRTRQTLNASKSVRNWTPNRGEVDRYVSPAASPSRRSDHGRVLFSARTLLFLVDPEKSCLGGMLPTTVHGPAYLRDDPALRYRSAQTRLFGIHKEQQSASREKYAPVVGTAARARGQRHVPVNLTSVWGPISHAF